MTVKRNSYSSTIVPQRLVTSLCDCAESKRVLSVSPICKMPMLPPTAPPLFMLELEPFKPDEVVSMRDSALELASASELTSALPLFTAAVTLKPQDAQIYSDLGVTWMRLGDFEQAWGAYGHALELDATHPLALQNRAELLKYLGESSAIVTVNALSPPRRPLHAVKHTLRAIERSSEMPSDDNWSLRPFVLEGQPPGPPDDDGPQLERTIATFLAGRSFDYYPGGVMHAKVIPEQRAAATILRRYRSAGGRAGRALVRIPCLQTSDYNNTLAALRVTPPPMQSAHVGLSQQCEHSLRSANQWNNFQASVMRRTLTLAAAPDSGLHMHRDALEMASWELMLRGSSAHTCMHTCVHACMHMPRDALGVASGS